MYEIIDKIHNKRKWYGARGYNLKYLYLGSSEYADLAKMKDDMFTIEFRRDPENEIVEYFMGLKIIKVNLENWLEVGL